LINLHILWWDLSNTFSVTVFVKNDFLRTVMSATGLWSWNWLIGFLLCRLCDNILLQLTCQLS